MSQLPEMLCKFRLKGTDDDRQFQLKRLAAKGWTLDHPNEYDAIMESPYPVTVVFKKEM
jgi:hypothetical protein